MEVAFYGGSFDPPHVGHVLAVSYLLSVPRFRRVLIVPVFSHPFAKPLVAFQHRLRMAELAMGWLSGAEVTALEAALGGPSVTLRTLEFLKRACPDYQLRLVVGADVLAERAEWHAFERVIELAPLLVLGRVGHANPPGVVPVLPDVSSTQVRSLLARRGDPAAARELERLLPAAVHEYIDQHDLYT